MEEVYNELRKSHWIANLECDSRSLDENEKGLKCKM